MGYQDESKQKISSKNSGDGNSFLSRKDTKVMDTNETFGHHTDDKKTKSSKFFNQLQRDLLKEQEN